MAYSQIDLDRNELHQFVIEVITPKTMFHPIDKSLEIHVQHMMSDRFGMKYAFIARLYDHTTLRISANKRSNGMMYFMAISLTGEQHDFSHEPWPTPYIGKQLPIPFISEQLPT